MSLLKAAPLTALLIAITSTGVHPQSDPVWTMNELDSGYVVFRHTTLENLSAAHVPARETIAGDLSCAMAQGEYESLHFGVYALADSLANISVAVTTGRPREPAALR